MGPVKQLYDIIYQLQKLMPVLENNYSVSSIGVFGSYIRAEQRPDSDLDLLVTFDNPPGLFKYIELENYLSDILGLQVDLVMKSALKSALKNQILAEVQTI